MRRLVLLALIVGGATWFLGADVLGSRIHHWRTEARTALAADIPLRQQWVEARQQIDAYAESIIRAEVAAEALAERIAEANRDVRKLETRAMREADGLAALRDHLRSDPAQGRDSALPHGRSNEVVPTATSDVRPLRLAPLAEVRAGEAALRQVRAYEATRTLLERRREDVQRLGNDLGATQAALAEAHAERARLADEATVLAAELESLEARKAAARTRKSVTDDAFGRNGFASARERIEALRATVREQNKRLAYYEVERDGAYVGSLLPTSSEVDGDPLAAIEEVLATWPTRDS